MADYSTLKALGISDLASIERYRLSSQGKNDLLEVFFRSDVSSASSNSFLFKFERHKVIPADSAAIKKAAKSEGSDPCLLAAVKELNQLFKTKRDA